RARCTPSHDDAHSGNPWRRTTIGAGRPAAPGAPGEGPAIVHLSRTSPVSMFSTTVTRRRVPERCRAGVWYPLGLAHRERTAVPSGLTVTTTRNMLGAVDGFRGTSRFVVEGRLGEGGMG